MPEFSQIVNHIWGDRFQTIRASKTLLSMSASKKATKECVPPKYRSKIKMRKTRDSSKTGMRKKEEVEKKKKRKKISLYGQNFVSHIEQPAPQFTLKLKTSHLAAPESSEHSSQAHSWKSAVPSSLSPIESSIFCLHWGEIESQSILSVPEATLVQILAFCTPDDHICQIQQDIKEVNPL